MPDNNPQVPRRGFRVQFNNAEVWNVNGNAANPIPTNDEEIIERVAELDQDIVARIRNRQQRRGNVGQVLDTVGIELESIALSRDTVASLLLKIPDGLGSNFKVHRDGSSEMNVYYVILGGGRNHLVVNSHTETAEELLEGKYPRSTVGYELISVPMDIDTSEITLHAVLPTLEANGDFISERCATHIHVGAMKNLGFLKNSLRLGLWFDEVFYSLAHMDGERFRGYSNNAIYARPLVNGPYFKSDRAYYQILNWENALDADDLYEFFGCYGVKVTGEMHKYHPGRYFSINLFSVARIGTLEFRHFNQTFNPVIVSSVAKLCQLFVEVAMKSRGRELKKLEPGDVFTLNSPSHYLDKLYKFMDLAASLNCEYYLEKEDIFQLEKVIYNYKGIGIENKEVLTHCRDFEVPGEFLDYLRKAKNKPCADGHVDIHNIRYQSIIK